MPGGRSALYSLPVRKDRAAGKLALYYLA